MHSVCTKLTVELPFYFCNVKKNPVMRTYIRVQKYNKKLKFTKNIVIFLTNKKKLIHDIKVENKPLFFNKKEYKKNPYLH